VTGLPHHISPPITYTHGNPVRIHKLDNFQILAFGQTWLKSTQQKHVRPAGAGLAVNYMHVHVRVVCAYGKAEQTSPGLRTAHSRRRHSSTIMNRYSPHSGNVDRRDETLPHGASQFRRKISAPPKDRDWSGSESDKINGPKSGSCTHPFPAPRTTRSAGETRCLLNGFFH
jgi:hypothetical protein